MSSITGRTLCQQVMYELGVLAAGEIGEGVDIVTVLGKVNLVLDNWNAERESVYADSLLTFTTTPDLNPHTIGPAGTWITTQRPVSIESANLVVNTARWPVNIRDQQWYAALTVPELATDYPTDLYYDQTWPSGSIYFYPVPSSAMTVELWVRVVLAALALDDVVSMPPGYYAALLLTAAEESVAVFGGQMPQGLPLRASKARARLQANNYPMPRLRTSDSGLPSGRSGYFNYLTGRVI